MCCDSEDIYNVYYCIFLPLNSEETANHSNFKRLNRHLGPGFWLFRGDLSATWRTSLHTQPHSHGINRYTNPLDCPSLDYPVSGLSRLPCELSCTAESCIELVSSDNPDCLRRPPISSHTLPVLEQAFSKDKCGVEYRLILTVYRDL